MQNTYPIFESGQVLMSKHLNDLASYLAEQDRLTRNKLIGIGIVCGLEVDYPSDGDLLRISAGVALTSEGHLIVQDECLLSQYRSYTLPTPEFEEIPEDLTLKEESQYPFFLDANGNQIQLWELFVEGDVPAPGGPEQTPLDSQFLTNKVVLLFLECEQNSLKSCELNDCSDKGAQQTFTVRKLLADRTDAQAMLDMEKAIAGRPVDLGTHPKFELKPLIIQKINPAGKNLKTFEDLADRILDILRDRGPEIINALQDGYAAYDYLLNDIYPASRFPSGPFGNTEFILKALDNLGRNIFLVQYIYDLLYDLIQSHNEFFAEARRIEAECCPNLERFPKHVLLGRVADPPTAFDPPKPGKPFDPLELDAGFGASPTPARFRHHFILSMLFDRELERLHRVRSLHYRTFLLAYRYLTEDLQKKEIKLTPSRDGDAALSEKAIPFYYAFQKDDDLHRNWSFDTTIKNGLEQIYAYRFTNRTDHPLQLRLENHNFYRVEGILGKSLGEAMRNLLAQKQELGLSFAIELVYMGLSVKDDPSSLVLDKQVQTRLKQAVFRLLICRFRDLDVMFLILMMTLFFFLFVIIALLTGLERNAVALLPRSTARMRTEKEKDPADPVAFKIRRKFETLRRVTDDKVKADDLLRKIRKEDYVKGRVAQTVRPPKGKEVSIGEAYEHIIKGDAGEDNLFDRTLRYAKTLKLDAREEDVAANLYPTVLLIDKVEELFGAVSSASIADLDFQSFEDKYAAFEIAYDEYLNHSGTSDTQNSPEIAEAQEALVINQNQMVAGGSVTLINSMMQEFQTRMGNILSELILEGYARRHPGMEHKCGVPKGGTLILLHTHQNLIRQVFGQNQGRINEKMNTVYEKLKAKDRRPAILDPQIVLPESKGTSDLLDDFVVLGDFCLPYLCCDTDCSDIVLKEPSQEIPRNGIVSGRIFGESGKEKPPVALKKDVISATNVDTKKPVAVKTVDEAYSFSAPAGTYRIDVKNRGYQSASRLIQIPEGVEMIENFLLQRLER